MKIDASEMFRRARAEQGDASSRILELLDSADEADRQQGFDLLVGAESEDVWSAFMDQAKFTRLRSTKRGYWERDEVFDRLPHADVETIEVTHADLNDSSHVRQALLLNPFHDYTAIKSILLRARSFDSLDCLARLTSLDEVVLDLRRAPDDTLPPRISLRGLDASTVRRLTVILDRDTAPPGTCPKCNVAGIFKDRRVICPRCNVYQENPRGPLFFELPVNDDQWRLVAEFRDAPSPHWPIDAEGWRFAEDWTRHLGRVEDLVVAASIAGSERGRDGMPDVFPYALTAHMPALRTVTIQGAVSFRHVQGQAPGPSCLRMGFWTSIASLPPARAATERISLDELVMIHDEPDLPFEPRTIDVNNRTITAYNTPNWVVLDQPRKLDLRTLLGLAPRRVAIEVSPSRPAKPLTVTHVEALHSFAPVPAFTAGDHVETELRPLPRDLIINGNPVDLDSLARQREPELQARFPRRAVVNEPSAEQRRHVAVVSLFRGSASAHALARRHKVHSDEIYRWRVDLFAALGEATPVTPPADSRCLEVFADELDESTGALTAPDVHVRLRGSSSVAFAVQNLPAMVRRLTLEGYPERFDYRNGNQPLLPFDAFERFTELEEITLVRIHALNATGLGALARAERLKKLTLLGCSPHVGRSDILELTKTAARQLKRVDIVQQLESSDLPVETGRERMARSTRLFRRAFWKHVLARGVGPGARLRARHPSDQSRSREPDDIVPGVCEVLAVDEASLRWPRPPGTEKHYLPGYDDDVNVALRVRFLTPPRWGGHPGAEVVLPLSQRFIWTGIGGDVEVVEPAPPPLDGEDAWVAGPLSGAALLEGFPDLATLDYQLRCLGV